MKGFVMRLAGCQAFPIGSTSGCLVVALCVWLGMFPVAKSEAIEPAKVEFLWQTSPKLDFDWEGQPYIPLIEATPEQIHSDSASVRLRAAQNVLRAPGSPRLDRPRALEAMLKRLQTGELNNTVRIELMAAACELDDGTYADQLWKLSQDDVTVRQTVELACIRWRKGLPLEQWRAAIQSAATTEQALLTAIDGIGATGSESDVSNLALLLMDSARSTPVRLRAAKAIGQVADGDRLALAKKLRESKASLADVMSVALLARSPVQSSAMFVQEIAQTGQPIAERAAYEWLCQRDGATAQGMAERFLQHSDSAVRRLALQQISDALSDKSLPALFAAFQDENPSVRTAARELVLKCCTRSETKLPSALELLKKSIDSNDWRELEQAIRLAVELKQSAYCERLLSLLDHARPEVCITSGWALRHLAEENAILQSMLEYVQVKTESLAKGSAEVTEPNLRTMAHLLEAFGLRKYEPAQPTAIKYVPKNFQMGLITRMAAAWTCGRLWERTENKPLIKLLHERIADKSTEFPEFLSVRFTATLALGMIGDSESRQPLIDNDEAKPAPIGYATEWALKQIDANR